MDTDKAAILMAMAGLLAAPPIAVLAFVYMHYRRRSAQSRIAWSCVAGILAVLGAVTLGLHFIHVLANIACIGIAYGAYCYLAASCWRVRFLPLRIFALITAAIPICAGYLLGTVGLLGVVFIVGDYARTPRKTQQVDAGLVCRVTDWGYVGSASGYAVGLYRSWTWLPFVERTVVSLSVDESSYVEKPLSATTCDDAIEKYRK